MTHQEFTERVNLNVSPYYFDNYVHPVYMRSELDKDAWCKLWKKNGGYQQAYDWERMQHITCSNAIDKHVKRIDDLNKEIEQLVRENKELRTRNNELEEETKNLTAEIEQLIEISETYSSAELRQLVIDKIGFKAYISYKLEHGKNLWEMDKDDLIKTLSA